MAEDQEWQPVRLAPLNLWHNVTETRRKQASHHVGEVFRVKPVKGVGPCGCRKLQVEPSYADKVYAERNQDPLPLVVCFECEVLAD